MKPIFKTFVMMAVVIILAIIAAIHSNDPVFIYTAGPAALTLLQMVDERKTLLAANEKLIKEGKDQFRSLDDDEQKKFNETLEKIKALDTQIANANSLTQRHVDPVSPTIVETKEKFSLLRTIRNLANNHGMHEADQIVLDQGINDFRNAGISPEGSISLPMIDHRHQKRADILAGTATQGAEIVGVDVLNIVGPLRAALVFSKVGATYLMGLVGNVDIPKYAGSTAGWKGEVAAAGDAAGAHSELSLTPLRITGYMDISKRYLIQDAVGAEELLKADLVAAVAHVLESKIMSNDAASAGVSPAGLCLDADDTFSGDAMAWGDVVDLEAAVDTANALEGTLAYITHPKMRGYMKQTAKVSSTDSKMIMEAANELNGYPVHTTSNMSQLLHTDGDETGLIFANYRHLIIAQWGGIDLVVDPYSLATEAQVRITVNSYWNVVLRHSGAWAFGSAPL